VTDATEPGPLMPGTGPTGMPGTGPTGMPYPQLPTVPDVEAPAVPYMPLPAAPPARLAPEALNTVGVPQLADSTQPADSITPASTPAPARRRRGGLVAVIALIVVGLVGVLGGGAALGKELIRKATKAEQAAALATEIASRWQRLAAGKIFPATISYTNGDGAKATATRAAIVPQTSCQSGLEPAAFQEVHPLGCATMLRATYIDAAGTQAVTVGIAVMSSPAAASRALDNLRPLKADAGLYAVPVAGTIANAFGNAQRGAAGVQIAGPYLLLYTAGYTDGMPGSDTAASNEPGALGAGILGALEPRLISHKSPCALKDIKC